MPLEPHRQAQVAPQRQINLKGKGRQYHYKSKRFKTLKTLKVSSFGAQA